MRDEAQDRRQNWEFDGTTITVRIPMTWKRRGGRKVIIAPGRRRRLGAGEAAAGRDADPRAGAGASVEAVAGGGQVPIGWRNWPKQRASPAASSTGCCG